MIGHQAVTQQPQRQPLTGLDHQCEKSRIVVGLVKHLLAGIPPIEHVAIQSRQ